jgi:acyl carrier protein
MENIKKYETAFCDAFELTNEQLQGLTYQGTELWDSVGHMTLISNLEEAFDIMMETDDIIDLSSYEKGIEILSNNYSIHF